MKINAILVLGFLLCTLSARSEVPVSVLSFKNKVGNLTCDQDWNWWRDHLGSAFQDMLMTELSKSSNIVLLERENIQDINNMEVNLVNSEKSEHKIEKGNFTKAKYTIVGAVSSYEYCAEKKKGGIAVSTVAGFFGIDGAARQVADTVNSVDISKASAKVVIDLRVVETKTGRVVKSVKAEGFAERSQFKIDSNLASYESAKETPVGEAARQAIEKGTSQILTSLN